MAQSKNATGGGEQAMYIVITVLGAWAIWQWIINPWLQSQQQQTTGTQPLYMMPGTAVQATAPVPTNAPAATPTTQNAVHVLPGVAVMQPTQTAARVAMAQQLAASGKKNLLGGTSTGGSARGGVSGIVPSWVSSGGPAFNAFIPAGGMTFSSASTPFGQPLLGQLRTPTTYLQ